MERKSSLENLVKMGFLNTYKGRKVLVTGHTGFKGGWLSLWLHHIGADVTGYSLDPEHPEGIFVLSDIGKKIKDYRGDIRDLNRLAEVFTNEKPEIVFHLAAQPLVLDSYNNPIETFETNIMGTANVLKAITDSSTVKAAIMITTDKCYENREQIWGYRENDAMGGHDPYSASKGAAELIISSWRRSFCNKKNSPLIASARAGNVIGGGDWCKNRLVPDIMRAILNNKDIEIRNPSATRPWQHVLEPLGGYLILGAALYEGHSEFASGWNFGPYPNEIYSVRRLLEKILEISGRGAWIDKSDVEKKHEANILTLDITKANIKLKWKPILTINETIEMTLEWYLKFKDESVEALSLKQIEFYKEVWKLRNGN